MRRMDVTVMHLGLSGNTQHLVVGQAAHLIEELRDAIHPPTVGSVAPAVNATFLVPHRHYEMRERSPR